MPGASLDYRTLFLASGIVGSALLILLAMQARKPYPGFRRVMLALIIVTVAIIIADVRGYVPDALLSVQLTALAAFAVIDSGVRLFSAAPRRGEWPYIYLLAGIFLVTYFYFTRPLQQRIVLTSLLSIPIFVDTALPLLSNPPRGRKFGYGLTAAVSLLGCVAAGLRIVGVSSLSARDAPYFSTNRANTIFFLLVLLWLICMAFGFIALAHERLVADLKSARERLLLALEASDSGTFEWNIKKNVDNWDPALEKLYGFEPGTFPRTPQAWLECVLPDDVPQVDEANRKSLKTGYFGEQWRIRRKNDGEIRWMLSHARVQFDQQGKPERMIGINVDVTNLKRREEKIRFSEQRYRSLVSASSQLVWSCDGDGYLQRELEDWHLFTGQTAEQMRGLGWLDAIHPEDREKTLEAREYAVKHKSVYAVEYRLRRNDGSYRIMQTRGVPVFDSDGQVYEWVGMCIDVTEQRLAEERLLRDEKLAVAGRLALNMSHEINNPLAAATNLVYLIGNDRSLCETTRTYAEMAELELERASRAVTRHLRFANTSSTPGDADLREITDSVIDLFQTRFETDRILIVRDYRTKAGWRGDPDELQDLIANLIGNAHEAMRHGGKLVIRIREASSWSNPRVQGVKLTIADTGIGIPCDVKDKMFEPFFTTKDETGAGLGLWMSSEILRKNNGRLSLRSSTDPKHPGTVFSLFFPSQSAPSAKAEPIRRAA